MVGDTNEEILVASSSIDDGIGSWSLQTGNEYLRFKSCASASHGLTCISNRAIASSQLRETKTSSGSIFYWSWSKPQVEVKSFLEEPINPIAADSNGMYLVGGGLSGHIYLWEVSTGRLLRKWRAHYRAVTCLVFNDDDSLLVSGSDDGSVRVWSLFKLFDDYESKQTSHLYELDFSEHTLCVTNILVSSGGGNAFIISASLDRTCKVWSISKGKLSRSIVFPSVIDAIALHPREQIFYAGSRDGKIYIAELNAVSSSIKTQGSHISDLLFSHGKAVSCLVYHENILLAGSEDGIIQVWDPVTKNIVRSFKLGKGPVNNIYIVKRKNVRALCGAQTSSRKQGSQLLRPLHKYVQSADGNMEVDPVVSLQGTCGSSRDVIGSSQMMANLVKVLEKQGSSIAHEIELERLKNENKESNQQLVRWKKLFDKLHEHCVDELLDADNK